MASVSQLRVEVEDAASAGAKAAADSLERLGRAAEQTDEKVKRAGPSIEALNRKYDENALAAAKAEQANNRYSREVDAIRAAVERGAKTEAEAAEMIRRAALARDQAIAKAQEHAAALSRLYAVTGTTTASMVAAAAANDNASRSFGRFGQVASSAGFQLQDFAVQVQSGTSAITAFAQQAPQFLGAFGTGGAIAGAVVAVAALAANFLLGADNSKEMQKSAEAAFRGIADSAKTTASVIREVNDLFLTASQRALAAYNARKEELRITARTQLDIAIQQQEAASMDRSTQQVEVARLEALAAANDRLRERQRRAGVTLDQDATGEAINSRLWVARAAVDGNTQAISRMSERITQLNATLKRLDEAPATPPEDPPRTRAERTVRERAGIGNRSIYEPGPGTVFPVDAVEPALTRMREEMEKAEQRRQELATKAIEEEERRRQQSFDRTVERYSADLSRSTVDALFDGAQRGQSFFGNLASAFGRALRSALAAGLDTAVFRPLIGDLLSGLGFAGSTTSSGGLTLGSGGLGSILQLGGAANTASGGGLLSRIGSGLGLTGDGGLLSGLGSSLGLTGTGGILGSTLWTTSAGAAASAPLAAGVAGPVVPTSALGSMGMGTTLGSLLGGVGAGFGAGALLNNLIGGNQTGGMVGSGAGAAAGAAIGSIIPGVGTLLGGLIGGLAGGAGGGLFGPTTKGMAQRAGGNVIWDVVNGQLQIVGAQGKRWDEAGSRAAVQQQLDQINAAVAQRGLTFGTGASDFDRNVGFGQGAERAGWNMALNQGAVVGLLRSANANVQTAIDTSAARGLDVNAALANVDWVQQTYEALVKVEDQTTQFAQQVKALSTQYDAAIVKARDLGLSEQKLTDARTKAIAQQFDALVRQATGQTYIDSILAVRANFDQTAGDVLAAGRDPNQLYAAQISAVINGLDVAALDKIIAFFDGVDETAEAFGRARKAQLEAAAAQVDAATAQQAAAEKLAQTLSAGGTIRAYLDQLASTDTAGLSPADQLANARAIYGRDVALARGGDADALGRITTSAGNLLTAGRGMYASSQDYAAILQGIQNDLGQLPAVKSYDEQVLNVLTAIATGQQRSVELLGVLSADVNSDQKITWPEFDAWAAANTIEAQRLVAAVGAGNGSLADIFDKLDENGDGTLSRLEIQNGLAAAANGLLSGVVGILSADANRDQRITWPEFDAWASANTAEFQRLAAAVGAGNGSLASIFTELDSNGDGTLTKLEIQNTLAASANALLASVAGLLSADANSDQRITWPEFDAWASSNTAEFQRLAAAVGSGNSSLASIFAELDGNGDGTLTKLEIQNSLVASSNVLLASVVGLLSADANSDQRITWPEFDAWASANTAEVQRVAAAVGAGNGSLASIFAKLDSNGDGTLTKLEIQNTLAASASSSLLGLVGISSGAATTGDLIAARTGQQNDLLVGLASLQRDMNLQMIAANTNLALGNRYAAATAYNTALLAGPNGVPAFAAGGDHWGGLRLVGERGPELEVTGPARIFSAAQTAEMLGRMSSSTANDTGDLVAEIRQLRAEVAVLRAATERTAAASERTASSNERMARDSTGAPVAARRVS